MNPIDIHAKFAASTATIVLLLIAMTVHGHADSFFPQCLSKTCSFGQCTEDWAGGLPLSKAGMRACCRYGGTAYSSANKIYCRGKR